MESLDEKLKSTEINVLRGKQPTLTYSKSTFNKSEKSKSEERISNRLDSSEQLERYKNILHHQTESLSRQ